ncbi:MAG TPA: tRNA (adenosine(37)-N6)-threonylcarbamoyltransferase complex ATPase subunit type 1 TsaE [Tahibacter sp.]|jgi:tRNA threonylcarbamoyladenosine biosynthesis protein TsaE|nr:tRNA (adenosine(37)-N6)-threonylcarbamoyltransferase complex ATPase subunit type 1 TsaE [Tahibacter sp.]
MTEHAARRWRFDDETALAAFARSLAPALRGGGVIYLHGDLGAGKTTLARALIGALGVDGRVKSPTYSLVESYALPHLAIHHLDLYRIADPGELEWLALDELDGGGANLVLVEWPERGAGSLPRQDVELHLAHADPGRTLHAVATTRRGEEWLAALPG